VLSKIRKTLKAQAVFEYMMLIVFVVSAFLVFQKYIVRAMSGRWRDVGDAFSYGQSYDPENTIECATFGAVAATEDPRFPDTEIWYNVDCFNANCMVPCFHDPIDAPQCRACIIACQDPDCN